MDLFAEWDMAIHKLADGPITLQVGTIEQVEGKFGMQYAVNGTDGTTVFVNLAPLDRQLNRLSLDAASAIGKTLRFEHVQKDGTTFTNVSLAPSGAPVGAGAPSTGGHAPSPKMTVQEAGALYGECVAQACVALGAQLEEAGVPVTAEAIQAAAATLFIKLSR